MIIDESSSDYSEADEDHYGSGDEECIERAMPSRGRGWSGNRPSPPICLHNEDLARGKPVGLLSRIYVYFFCLMLTWSID